MLTRNASARRAIRWLAVVVASVAVGALTPALAQVDNPMNPPDMLPPPPPPRDAPEADDEARPDDARGDAFDFFPEEGEGPWGLPDELLERLAAVAEKYRARSRQFEATEVARTVKYKNGEAGKERTRRYSYILGMRPDSPTIRESRAEIGEGGGVKNDDVQDSEPFPPAYGWVLLFSDFHQSYFSYRDLGDRFDGFDWVREIRFKGALPFTDGRDIRQWEGIATVDASTYTPIRIVAQPSNQPERLRQVFEQWNKSFNLLGMRTGPKPLGYKCEVEFRFRAKSLTFPTRLRYDTFRVASRYTLEPVRASSRDYTSYRFFGVATEEEIGDAP